MRGREIRVDRLQPHFGVERPHDELADRNRLPVEEERTYPQIWVNAFDVGAADASVGEGRQRAVADPFADQLRGYRTTPRHRLGARSRSDRAKIGGDFVRQHLF